MAGNPDQLHVIETTQPFAGIRYQDKQPGNLRAALPAYVTNGNIAVAAQQQPPGAGFTSHFQCNTERMQFGLVVAAGGIEQHGFFATLSIGRDEQDTDTDLAGIRQGRTVKPRLPVIRSVYRDPGVQNRLATTKRSRAASFSRPLTASIEPPHFMMCARKVVSPCDSA